MSEAERIQNFSSLIVVGDDVKRVTGCPHLIQKTEGIFKNGGCELPEHAGHQGGFQCIRPSQARKQGVQNQGFVEVLAGAFQCDEQTFLIALFIEGKSMFPDQIRQHIDQRPCIHP